MSSLFAGDLASSFIEKVVATARECLQAATSLHIGPHTQPSPGHSGWTNSHHTSISMASSISSFSWIIPISIQASYFLSHYLKTPLLIPVSSQTAPFLCFISEQSFGMDCLHLQMSLLLFSLNPICWCFCLHNSTRYTPIKDIHDITVSKATGHFSMSSHWLISFGHIWSLSPILSLLPLGSKDCSWPGCLPAFLAAPALFLFCFLLISLTSKYWKKPRLGGLCFHPHPHHDESICLKALNVTCLMIIV